jgi:hypothetical protein
MGFSCIELSVRQDEEVTEKACTLARADDSWWRLHVGLVAEVNQLDFGMNLRFFKYFVSFPAELYVQGICIIRTEKPADLPCRRLGFLVLGIGLPAINSRQSGR